MDSDNHSTASPVTRNEPKDDSGYDSQETSPPPNSSQPFTDRAIAKGKSVMSYCIRKPKKLRPYHKPIPQLTLDRFSDLRGQYAARLNELTRGLPSRASILMSLQVLGENEESAEPWVFIQCDKAVVRKIKRFFRESVNLRDFEPPQPNDNFPRLRVHVQPHKPRSLGKNANAPQQSDSLAIPKGNEIYMLESDATQDARGGTQIMTEYLHGVHQATMGGFVKAIDPGNLETTYGMTAGHFFFEELYDDVEYSPASDSDEEYDEDVESFELDLNFIEANSKDEDDRPTSDKSAIEFNEEVNMGEWSRLGKLSTASHNLLEGGSNLDWGLITIDEDPDSSGDNLWNLDPASIDFGKEQTSVRMNSVRRPLEGILHGYWSYIMLPPSKVLVRAYLLSLPDGKSE